MSSSWAVGRTIKLGRSRRLPWAATSPAARSRQVVVGPRKERHRSCAVGVAPAKLSPERAPYVPGAGKWPAADPIVRDNLGDQVPVCAAELDVIDTYLDQVLRDLLASPQADSEQEQS